MRVARLKTLSVYLISLLLIIFIMGCGVVPFDTIGDEIWDFRRGRAPDYAHPNVSLYTACVRVNHGGYENYACAYDNNSWEDNICLEIIKDESWCDDFLMVDGGANITVKYLISVKRPHVYLGFNPEQVKRFFPQEIIPKIDGNFIIDSFLREDKRYENYFINGMDYQFNHKTSVKYRITDYPILDEFYPAYQRYYAIPFGVKSDWVKKMRQNTEMDMILRVGVMFYYSWETRTTLIGGIIPAFVNTPVKYYFYKDIKFKIKYDPSFIVCGLSPTQTPFPTLTFTKTFTTVPTLTPTPPINTPTPWPTISINSTDTPNPTDTPTPGPVEIDTELINKDPNFLSNMILEIPYSFSGVEPNPATYSFEIISDQSTNSVLMTGAPSDVVINTAQHKIFFKPQAVGSSTDGSSNKSVGLKYKIKYMLNNVETQSFIIEQDDINRARQEYKWFSENNITVGGGTTANSSSLVVPSRTEFGITSTIHGLDLGTTAKNYNDTSFRKGSLLNIYNTLISIYPSLKFTCTWRSPYFNLYLGSKWDSPHLIANAVDVWPVPDNGGIPLANQFQSNWDAVVAAGYHVLLERGPTILRSSNSGWWRISASVFCNDGLNTYVYKPTSLEVATYNSQFANRLSTTIEFGYSYASHYHVANR